MARLHCSTTHFHVTCSKYFLLQTTWSTFDVLLVFLPPCCLLQESLATRYMKMSGATVVIDKPD